MKKKSVLKSLTPEQFREKWLRALKGGRYKQTTNYLKNDNGYCCLGVACEIYNKNFTDKLEIEAFENSYGNGSVVFIDNGSYDSVLPPRVKKALGLQTQSGDFKYKNGASCSLVDLNDSGKTFKEIAKLIESKPKGLFVTAKKKVQKKIKKTKRKTKK